MRSLLQILTVGALLFTLSTAADAGPKEDLFKGLKWKSLTRVKKALSAGASINSRNDKGKTPLMLSAEKSTYPLFKYLIDSGADTEKRDHEGNSAAHYVAACYSTYIVKYAISKKLDFAALNRAGETPLMTAILKARYANMTALIKTGVNIEARSSEGKTPLLIAGEKGYSAFVNALIKAGANMKARDRQGNNLLHLTVAKNDYKTVTLLLKENFPLNETNREGKSALIIAAETKRKYITKLLLAKEVNAALTDNTGKSALHYNAEGPYYWYMKSMTEKGAEINRRDKGGKTPLLLAVESGRHSNIKALVHAGANANLQDKTGLLPVHVAYNKRLYQTMAMLLAGKADANRPVPGGKTMLIDAVERNSTAFTALLLKNGADPNIKSPEGKTPLFMAVEKNRYSLIRPLLKAGADVSAPDPEGKKPMVVMVERGYAHMLNALVEHKGNVNDTDSKGRSLLLIAHTLLMERFNEFRSKMLTSLIRKGANVNITDSDKVPLLLVYVNRGLTFYTGLFLEHGARLSVKDRNGDGPMHLGVKSGSYQLVKLLINKKIPVTTKGNQGNTPLHYAVKTKKTSITSVLLKGGASANIKNEAGYTPVHLAVQQRNSVILADLIAHGANLNIDNGYGNSLLMESCKIEGYQTDKTSLAIIDTLIKGGAKVNQKNRYGNTPLMYAINRQNVVLVEYLLKKGADPNMTDSRGNTPLKKTIINGVYSSLKNETLRRIIYTLVTHGADINRSDKQGVTPLIEASKGGLDKDRTAGEQAVQVLLDLNADPSKRDREGNDALFYARQQNSSRLQSLLKINRMSSPSAYGFPETDFKKSEIITFTTDSSGMLYLLIKKNKSIYLQKRGSDGGTFFNKNITFGDALAAAPDGYIYVLGARPGTIKGKTDRRCKAGKNLVISLRRYNSSGGLTWEQTDAKYRACEKTNARRVTVDTESNAYIGMNFGHAAHSYLAKYTPTGKRVFRVKRYGTWSRLFMDEKENLLLFGKFTHFYSKRGGRKYSLTMTRLRDAKAFGVTGTGRGQIFFCAGSAKKGFYVSRLSYRGGLMWKRFFRSTGEENPTAVAVDAAGNAYVAGSTSGTLHGQKNSGGKDLFLMKLDKEGNRVWTRTYGSSGNDEVVSMRADTRGGLFISGTSEEPGAPAAGGAKKTFLVKYTSSGSRYRR